ncbi:MAG: protein kinase [Myxococcaceae bacterium]|nr:protein kinase [Myxococcaceae bacterium]
MADALSPGMVVADTFEVERLLGRGGMGEVWLGRHLRLSGKQVAIKVLHTQGQLSPEALARFRREAEIAVRLEHPNIVQVLDFNNLPAGQPFIVMELLKGESLAGRLRRGPLSPDETSHVMRQVGSALHAAHAAGVIHRDLKPENIYLVPTALGDQVKVLDFGISKLADSGTMQTTDSVLMGTPLYMSPEQALGHNRDVTPSSDVFSLGSIAYECLTGKAPFEADNIAKVVFRIAYEPHPPLRAMAPHVPEVMASAVEHALQKERDKRTPSVAAFVLELTGQVLAGTPSTPAAASGPPSHSGVASPGQAIDEQMMASATVAPSSNIVPKPQLATPSPPPAVVTPSAPARAPALPTGERSSPLPQARRSPVSFVVGGAVLLLVAGGTFVIARALDSGASAAVDAGSTLPAVVVDAGLPAPIDAGVVEAPGVRETLDAGQVLAASIDAGVTPKAPPKALTPPPAADRAVLAELKAQLDAGKVDDVWQRRGPLRNRFTSKEGVRDFLILMVEVACVRGDLGNANSYARQLAEFPPSALDAARKRCRKYQEWSLD